ncbi:MAG: helix-turn-helix domain-containing protein [Planctomycetota bacterium]
MFGTIVRELLDQKLTSLKELEEVTGRGTSTIYRWINDETEPHFTDVRLLVRHLDKPEARHTLVGLLTADLPVVIDWLTEESRKDWGEESDVQRAGHEVLERSLFALDCLSDALSEGNEAIRKQELTKDAYVKIIALMDETIRHLTAGKNMLQKYSPIIETGKAT